MKTGALICVLTLVVSAVPAVAQIDAQTDVFEKAQRLGEGTQRSFFMFTASSGKYIIRHDGMGQIATNKTHLTFHLRFVTRLEQVYFYEHQGDVLLAYEVNDGRSYLARLNPQTRKQKWVTRINAVGPCKVEHDEASCDATRISLKTGDEIKPASSPSSSSSSLPTRESVSSMSARVRRKAA